jgi:polygalacturonase
MKNFTSVRRDFLKLGGMGLAASLPSVFAQGQTLPQRTAASPIVFDVRAFGTTGAGKALDTLGINAAIDAAAAAGGGTVYFPAGTYLCFSIRLKSNVSLYLEQGCKIIAAASPRKGETTGQMGGVYDAAEPNLPWSHYTDFGHAHWHNSLIWGEDLHDIAILGPGLIDGSGLSPGYPERDRAPEQAGVGNKSIALKNCRNVVLSSFSILKGGWFALLLTGVDNLTIDNLKIDTNRDGMDIDCCRNVVVSNCLVNAPYDDAICPKSSLALGYLRATENVTITNCVVSGGYRLGTMLNGTFKRYQPGEKGVKHNGRIKCGTESNGGFKNIAISNCVFDNCYGLSLDSVDGALCEDITITNITMRDIIAGPLFFRLGARLRGPQETTKVGTLRRILVSNINSFNAAMEFPSILSGIPGHPIEDVKIANVYSHHQGGGTQAMAQIVLPEDEKGYPDPVNFGPIPAQGFYLRHIRNVELSHIEIAPQKLDARTSFYLQNVDRADFLAVTAPSPGFTLNEVTDLRILHSRAAKDTILPHADGQII